MKHPSGLAMEDSYTVDFARGVALSAWSHPQSGSRDGSVKTLGTQALLLWREAGSPLPHTVHLGPFILIEAIADFKSRMMDDARLAA